MLEFLSYAVLKFITCIKFTPLQVHSTIHPFVTFDTAWPFSEAPFSVYQGGFFPFCSKFTACCYAKCNSRSGILLHSTLLHSILSAHWCRNREPFGSGARGGERRVRINRTILRIQMGLEFYRISPHFSTMHFLWLTMLRLYKLLKCSLHISYLNMAGNC